MTTHPIHPILPLKLLESLPQEQAQLLISQREALITREKADPFRFTWIGPMWKILISALDVPVPLLPDDFRKRVRRRLQLDRALRFAALFGGNRSGKSYGAAWLTNQILTLFPQENTACFQYNEATSIETQQRALYNMLPAELRPVAGKKIKDGNTAISFHPATGFPNGRYVMPAGNMCVLRYYTQDELAGEGTRYKLAWQDENAPPKLRESYKLRVADSRGWLLSTWSPIDGYTPLVRQVVEACRTVLECPAYLLPTDGGPPDIPRAFGFSSPEEQAEANAHGIYSKPFDIDRWLDGGDLHPAPPPGRTFEQAPLIQLGNSEPLIAVYNATNNNPYVNPNDIYEALAKTTGGEEFIRRRWYGWAKNAIRSAFPMFSRKVHVVPHASIPPVGDNYHIVDPGPGNRNYFMIWGRVTPIGVFIYREWPGHYPIPGIGTPGWWAVPSDDPDKHDGDKGPAQDGFRLGTIGYKREIARLEGWSDYRADLPPPPPGTDAQASIRERVAKWDPAHGTQERITLRLLDARFGNSVVTNADGVEDYYSSYARVGIYFSETAGKRADGKNETETGLARLADWLEYDPRQPLDVHNRPKLFISEQCVNCITALETYTGADGGRGAWKDVIDTIRYFAQANVEYIPPEQMRGKPGRGL